MAKKDTSINLKKRLKNTNAKLKRRDDKIARLEAKVAQMEADAKKKPQPKLWTEFFRIFQKDSKASVLRVRYQVCNYAQMRNKLQYSRHC